jgi:hypothetical protein
MKISTVQVLLEPKDNEEQQSVYLSKTKEKTWVVTDMQGNRQVGLFAGEAKLVVMIQELIQKFNGNEK